MADDLDSWLGDELNSMVDHKGLLTIEQIVALKGREADLEIALIYNDTHETAFRHIVRIHPPGTLVDDDRAAA